MLKERTDYEIMLARVKAKARGATPVEVQRNVQMLWDRREAIAQHFASLVQHGDELLPLVVALDAMPGRYVP